MSTDIARSYYLLLHAVFGERLSDEFTLNDQDTTALKLEFENILGSLSNREERLIHLRFGLDDGMPRTHEELASEMSISADESKSLEIAVIDKLRHPSRSQVLRPFLD